MANEISANLIKIDTFTGTITLEDDNIEIANITFISTNVGDHCVLTDVEDKRVYESRISVANGCDNQNIDTTFNGIKLNASLGTYVGTAVLYIYLQ